jgi:16S rRNA (uracil1498-N3)-methyltransferase
VNLILLEPGEVAPDGRARLADARAAHIITVLRATAGREIRVGMVDGPLGAATVVRTGDGEPHVELQCTFDQAVPERPRVDLLLALPRPKVMRRLWAQLAALGVGRIMLSNAERVERSYFDTHVLAPQHVRPHLIEGLQQARDTRLPLVTIHRQFRVLIEDDLDALTGDAIRLVTHPAAPASMHQAVRSALALGAARERLLIAVGPEGGWNDFELRLLETHRFQRVGMGPRTLRADTACAALLALAHDAYCEAAGEAGRF